MPEKQEEVEIVPVTPLRKLEKRIEDLEATRFNEKEFYRELVDIIRLNQQLVNQLATANDALRIEISKLPSKLEDLISRLDELLSFIKETAEEEVPSAKKEHVQPLADKVNQLIETNKKLIANNEAILSVLESIEKKFKKPMLPVRRAPLPPVGKPIIHKKPL